MPLGFYDKKSSAGFERLPQLGKEEALVGYFVLLQFFSDTLFGVVFAGVAGIMVFISLDELLPAAREYGEPHLAIYGLIAGMLVMAISLLMFL